MVEGLDVGQQWLVLLPQRSCKGPQVALAQMVVSLLAHADGVAGPLATSLPTPQGCSGKAFESPSYRG